MTWWSCVGNVDVVDCCWLPSGHHRGGRGVACIEPCSEPTLSGMLGLRVYASSPGRGVFKKERSLGVVPPRSTDLEGGRGDLSWLRRGVCPGDVKLDALPLLRGPAGVANGLPFPYCADVWSRGDECIDARDGRYNADRSRISSRLYRTLLRRSTHCWSMPCRLFGRRNHDLLLLILRRAIRTIQRG